MVEESNQNVFLTQTDASNFAEFEISEFEISGFDCTTDINEGGDGITALELSVTKLIGIFRGIQTLHLFSIRQSM